MRQKSEFAIFLAPRRCPVGLSAFLTLAFLFGPSVAAFAQPPAPAAGAVLEEDENRKAANISWNPKLDFNEWKAINKQRFIEFTQKLNSPSLTEPDRKLILKQLQNQIHGLTLEQNVDLHARIVDEIARAAELPSTSQSVRDLILENSLKIAEPLLKDQPPNVQYAVALLAARLNSKAPDLIKRVPGQPYAGSQKLLMAILANQATPISARIMAARGLDRQMRDGDISTVDKATISTALADALKQKVENPLARKWYRFKLVEALGAAGRWDDVGHRPVVIDALASVLVNRQDDWEVRAAAARSLSQLPLDATTNNQLVNYEIVRLLSELVHAYNPSDKMPPSTWRWAFDNIYLSYHSATVREQNVLHWGLKHLNGPNGKPQIESAYAVVLPVVKQVVEANELRSIGAAQLKALDDWLANNKPANRKMTSQSEELKEPVLLNGAEVAPQNINGKPQ